MADGPYDVVICGTGLKECILGGLLSNSGKKVLHVDRNDYYGGESASLNLTQIFQKFRPGQDPPAKYGRSAHWSVDLIPKFVMVGGDLLSILIKTEVKDYLQWEIVAGTYLYQWQDAGWLSNAKAVHKVPATASEAAWSPLMSLLEKNRCKNFFQFVAAWRGDDEKTHNGFKPGQTMEQVYAAFGLCENTTEYIGHAVALYTSDDYLSQAYEPTVKRIQLYANSNGVYGNSPFIYPLYGQSSITESFVRKSALKGCTFVLDEKVGGFEYDKDGQVRGVLVGNDVVACKMVICDTSYAPAEKKELVGKLIRAICILGAPLPNTDNSTSCQLIIPQRQLNRGHDIYISVVSHKHQVTEEGKFVAIVSTTVETDDPEKEIEPALKLLGEIEDKFVNLSDIYQPTDDGKKDQVFVTASYDATSHFQSAVEEVLAIWNNISGSEFDVTLPEQTDTSQSKGDDGRFCTIPFCSVL